MTAEAQLAKTRVMNSSRVAMHGEVEKASIGMQGAIVYALLDVASALRNQGPDGRTEQLLRVAGLMADALADGNEAQAKQLAQDFALIQDGHDYDQHLGLGH